MGWPRKNEEMRLYQEPHDQSFILVVTANGVGRSGYDAIANVMNGPSPSLGSTVVNQDYLSNRCKRVEWSDMTPEWQTAMERWLIKHPSTIRGFWKTQRSEV